jgi:hypothetical protein
MTDTLDRRRSVTRGDYLEGPITSDGGVWVWNVMDPGALTSPTPSLPAPSRLTWSTDAVLAGTLALEDMWAGAINQAVTKLAVRDFEVSDSDDSTLRTRKGQDLILNFDGPVEWRSGVNKIAQDFLLSRNGCFIEVERVSKTPNSKIRALWHLDTHRCRRTGHPDYPVVYWSLDSQWHPLRADQVIFFADMPSPRAELYGIGTPAAERAFKTIVKLAAVETYFREKITGTRALKLVFISGMTKRKLEQVKETSDAEMERRGYTVYKGAVVVPTETDQAISIAEVDLAGVPDGFDVEQERRDAYLRYANAIGIPVQDLQPLSGQGLGTGTQTVILAEEAEGRGLIYFSKMLEDKLNWMTMPRTTTFQFKTNDLRDQQAQAQINQTKANTILALKGSPTAPGIISDVQALNMAVDDGIVPKEFLPEDITPEGTATSSGDQSKPAGEGAPAGVDMTSAIQQAVARVGTKEVRAALEAAGLSIPPGAPVAGQLTEAERADLAQRVGNLSDAIIAEHKDDDDWQAALKWAKQSNAD